MKTLRLLSRRFQTVLIWLSAVSIGAALESPPATAQLPSALELAEAIGLTAADAENVRAGEFVHVQLEPTHERELTSGFVFLVEGVTPTELVQQLRRGELEAVDPTIVAFEPIPGEPNLEDFARLELAPDSKPRVAAFLDAEPGTELNLSAVEIDGFRALGAGAPRPAVEARLRADLLARLQAYRAKGLAGIAPYARSRGELRSPAQDLRSATQAASILRERMPAAYQLMLDYPQGKPTGLEETFAWSQIMAHGDPAIVLSHSFSLPDGEAWINVQRQFYVSTGFNCEQAVAAFLPVTGGTVVFYANRTSTDQITGFGGGAKRSIGSKLLASQLEDLFERKRSAAAAKTD